MAQLIIDIIKRAKTFEIGKWQYRSPDLYSPYKLASQGYQCVLFNTLECHVCHNNVAFVSKQGYERPESEIMKQIQSHENTCEYYGQKGKIFSKGDLYLAMDKLIQITKQSHRKQSQKLPYPYIGYKSFQQHLVETKQLQMLNAVLSKSKIDPKQFKISFILTIMGWTRKSIEELECAFCGRMVNVKEYRICFQDKQTEADVMGVADSELLDLFGQHRYFCLWVHQQNGWEIYVQHLYDKLGEAQQLFKNKDPQDIKKIRTLIDGYLQNFKNNISQNFQKANKILLQCSQMVKQLESNQQIKGNIDGQVRNRQKQMHQFLQEIQSDVRAPLKRVKID